MLAHGVAQRVGQVGLGQPGGGRQQLVVHVAAAGGGDAYDGLRARVERVDAGQQHVAQRRRQPLGALPGRRDELLGEERVALGAREDSVEQRLGRSFAEDSRQLFARLGARQAIERQPPRAGGGRHVGEEAAQALVAIDLVAAVRRDDEDALVAQPAREVGQQLERRAIGPVDVLDDEQDRRGRRCGGEAVEDERVKAGGWPRGAHRHKPGVEEVLGAVVEPAQRVDHGQQRDRRLVEPDALPGEDLVAVGAGARGQLGDEPALAHAGLAAHEHEARRARACPRHRGDELAQLVRAADEDGARDARRHRPSIAPPGKYVAGAQRNTSSCRCSPRAADLPSTHRFVRPRNGGCHEVLHLSARRGRAGLRRRRPGLGPARRQRPAPALRMSSTPRRQRPRATTARPPTSTH